MAALTACLVSSGTLSALPVIRSFNPTSGAPGMHVTLNGLSLDKTTRVTFGGEPAAYLIVNDTQIVALVPPAAVSGPVGVSSIAGTTRTAASFGVAPRVEEFSPLSAGTGDLIEVAGANFVAGATTVVVAGATSTVVQVLSPDRLTATVPGSATTGPVAITTPHGTDASTAVFVRSEAPVIASVTPSSGPPGTQVSLAGANFTGTTAVRLNGQPAGINGVSENLLTFTVPNGAASGLITVSTLNGGTGSSTANFMVGPRIIGFSPGRVIPGDVVRVTCSSLVGLAQVKIGNIVIPASNLRSVSAGVMDLTVPANAVSGLISSATAAGLGMSEQPLIIGPELTSFSPTSGPVDTLVRLQGAGLQSISNVRFGGLPAAQIISNPGGLYARVPAGAANGVITVQTTGGAATSADPFLVTVGQQPNIESFTPMEGVPGVPLRIRGIQLGTAVAVGVGGVEATEFLVLDDRNLEVVVPYPATSGPVTVTTPFGTATSSQLFRAPVVKPPALPNVQITPVPQAASVIVSWPADLISYRLECTQGGDVWHAVQAMPVVIDGRNYVTNPMSSSVELYRLSYP
jgi:hypothetical protein